MSWTQRFASFFLAALFICGGAQAQPDIGNGNNGNSAAAAAAAPAPTIAELRAQFTKLSNPAETDDDARKLLAQINDIGVQADKFVAARTGDLADLNAKLGELGNPPAAGATEDPDITRQRARLTKERNALDADIRLAGLLSVDVR